MATLPQAVLLDLDGTLIDSELTYAEAIARVFETQGHTLDDRDRAFVIGHGWTEIHRELHTVTRIGMDLAALKAATVTMTHQMLADGHEIAVVPGARELVAMIAALEIPQAIVSGSSRREIEHALTILEIEQHLSLYVGAEDVTAGKPNPEGYLAAAAHIGVTASTCLVVEDSHAGVAAARAAGMRVIGTEACNPPEGHAGRQDLRDAHRVVSSLTGLSGDDLRDVMR